MVSETFQSISGGEGMVTGGQRGWLSPGTDQEVERARPEAGVGTMVKDLLLPTSFCRPGPFLTDSAAFKLVPQARDQVSVQNV